MKPINHRFSVFYTLFANALTASALLLGIIISLPQPVYAQTQAETLENTESQKVDVKKSDDDIDEITPLEAGTGGKLRREKTYRTKAESLFQWHTHLLWESRYVTEGRDNLAGDSLLSASSEFLIDDLTVVPWIAVSPDTDYSEFNLNLVYGFSLTEDLVVYAGYTYLQARLEEEKASDNEISLAMDYKLFKRWSSGAVIYHSFDANGSFMEFSVHHGYKLNKKFHLHASALLGVNADYIPDGHNGLNNFQLRLDVAYQPITQMEVYAYTSYNQAINRDAANYAGDELLDDFFWGGIGLTYRF